MCNMLWKLNKVSSSAVIELPKINSFCMSCMLKEIHEVEQKYHETYTFPILHLSENHILDVCFPQDLLIGVYEK